MWSNCGGCVVNKEAKGVVKEKRLSLRIRGDR
jgi:hypothetical protein